MEDSKNIQLWQGDCLELMKNIPDESVDMVLCDLPYGIMEPNHTGKIYKQRFGTQFKWDTRLDIGQLFKEYSRIVKCSGRVVLTSMGDFTFDLYNNAQGAINFSQKLIWNKNGKFGNHLKTNNSFVNTYEDILVFNRQNRGNRQISDKYKSIVNSIYIKYGEDFLKTLFLDSGIYSSEASVKTHLRFKFATGNTRRVDLPSKKLYEYLDINGVNWGYSYSELQKIHRESYRNQTLTFNNNGKPLQDILTFNPPKNRFHPTQKPVPLLEHLIKVYTNEGMVVLDNTMGSGSTGVACKNLNRKFIGIELDEEYFNIARERIKNI